MPKTTVAGHPLHPMMIVAPAALIPFSFVMDAMHRYTGDNSYADAAYYSLIGGFAGGIAAGIAGAMDYMEVESRTEVKRTANLHATLNMGALALAAVNLLRKRGKYHHQGGSIALSGLATAGVLVSSWFGGHLVYKHGMRVEQVSPVRDAPEISPPADETMEQLILSLEHPVTSAGTDIALISAPQRPVPPHIICSGAGDVI